MKEQKILILDNPYISWQAMCDDLTNDGWYVISVTPQKVAGGKTETGVKGGFVIVLERDKK